MNGQTASDTGFKPLTPRWWPDPRRCLWNCALEQRAYTGCARFKSHPFKRLMDAGVRTTVNTDDHGVMDISLLKVRELDTHLGVSMEDSPMQQWAREASIADRIKRFGPPD